MFTDADLEHLLGTLHPELLVMEQTFRTLSDVHWFTACQYRVAFPKDCEVSERVLWPSSPVERRGMEDARFVRFRTTTATSATTARTRPTTATRRAASSSRRRTSSSSR